MRESADVVALQALTWLIGHDELRPVFLAATGASAADLRDRAGDPDLLASVLDFLLMEDAWIRDFCAETGLPGEAVMRARAALPGGADPHWT